MLWTALSPMGHLVSCSSFHHSNTCLLTLNRHPCRRVLLPQACAGCQAGRCTSLSRHRLLLHPARGHQLCGLWHAARGRLTEGGSRHAARRHWHNPLCSSGGCRAVCLCPGWCCICVAKVWLYMLRHCVSAAPSCCCLKSTTRCSSGGVYGTPHFGTAFRAARAA